MERFPVFALCGTLLLIASVEGGCGFPGRPESGSVRYRGLEIYPDHVDIKDGFNVVYDCNSNRRLSGHKERICLSNGSWSGSLPLCLENIAKEATLVNGNLGKDCQLENYRDGPNGKCATGCYENGNSLHLLNLTDRLIDGIRFTGEGIANLRPRISGPGKANEIAFQRSATESEVYLSLNGTRWHSIQISFEAQGRVDVCEIEVFVISDSCGYPEEPANGRVTIINRSALYQCNLGYDRRGPLLSNCTSGRWTGQQTTCNRINDFSWKWLSVGISGTSIIFISCIAAILIRTSRLLKQRGQQIAVLRNISPRRSELKEPDAAPSSESFDGESAHIYDTLDGVTCDKTGREVDSQMYLKPNLLH